MPQKRFKLDGKGQIHGEEGGILDGGRGVDADRIEVPYLVPHVVTFDVGSNETSGLAKVLVRYSCHCWSSEWDDPSGSISGKIRILDGANERAFDSKRFNASLDLPTLIEALPETQVYVTRSERNYGCYNASRVGKDGMA